MVHVGFREEASVRGENLDLDFGFGFSSRDSASFWG